MSVELKIKSKHLAEEAKIIRFEERKLKAQARWLKKHKTQEEADVKSQKFFSLVEHRRKDVRNENRSTYLARAFLAGVPYKVVETSRKEENEYTFKTYILPRVKALVAKYGSSNVKMSADALITMWISV